MKNDDADAGLSKDEKIVQQAKTRFKQAQDWESVARENFVFDLRFDAGDATNHYQWPDDIRTARIAENKPILTVNKVHQNNLRVINDQRQNPTQVEIRPVGNGASVEAAKVFEGVIRHIEENSSAQLAYNNAVYGQVVGGVGYWRITTDYASEDSFDQEIFIKRVADPLSIYLDPDITEADGSDARWGFVFEDLPRDQFERKYPQEAGLVGLNAPLGTGPDDNHWETKDHVRVAEYFRRSLKNDTLHELDNGMSVKESEVKGADLLEQLKVNSVRTREIESPQIEWFLIAGSKIVDRKDWAGRYIPIVRVIGEETVIDGKMDRRGLTRCQLDSQRIWNYWASSAVEQVALQPKSPFITPVEAIRGFEENWAGANIDSKAYLPYNGISPNGDPIPKPERSPPPIMSQAFLDGMKIAASEMMVVTGIYEANLGVKSNEVSGKAVDARARQGDTATYHFIDRFSHAIRYTGRILVDLIPKIYDSARVMKILAENGDPRSVQIDPNAAQAHVPVQNPDHPEFDPNAIQAIWNPAVGQYSVIATIGPDYETRRQENFNAISKILQADPGWAPIIGDLMVAAADFPGAQEMAKRLHNMVPLKALGINTPDPQVAQLQELLAKQHQELIKMESELTQAKNKSSEQEQQKQIDLYDAETRRMTAVGKIDPAAMMPIIRQLVSEALGTPINPIIAAHALENSQMEQVPEAPPSQVLAPEQPSSE